MAGEENSRTMIIVWSIGIMCNKLCQFVVLTVVIYYVVV